MWHVGSQFPDKESNPYHLQWKHRVLATGPPGKPGSGVFVEMVTYDQAQRQVSAL